MPGAPPLYPPLVLDPCFRIGKCQHNFMVILVETNCVFQQFSNFHLLKNIEKYMGLGFRIFGICENKKAIKTSESIGHTVYKSHNVTDSSKNS